MYLSERVQKVEPSATLAMTARAKALKEQGIHVLVMSAGEPDFPTPQHICEAAKKALDANDTKYTPVAGTAALRNAIVQYTKRVYGYDITAAETIVGTGGKQVLFNACASLLNPGDEAIFPSPYWVSYPDMIRFADGVPVALYADESKNFLPQAQDIEAVITPKTRLLILNSPSNPTGSMYTRAQLEAIAKVLEQHPNIFIITDDIYGGLVYDGEFVSLAHVAPQLRERMLIATGVAKTYSMTGWRIGFGIGPKELINAMSDLQGASTSGACSIAQAAAVAALNGDHAPIEAMRQAFEARRNRMVQGLRTIPGLEVLSPAGAFYVFPRITSFLSERIPNSQALCEYILNTVHVAMVPGSAFGSEHHVRLSFACSDQDIDDAVERLKRGLAAIRSA